jgi:hypothetical protein
MCKATITQFLHIYLRRFPFENCIIPSEVLYNFIFCIGQWTEGDGVGRREIPGDADGGRFGNCPKLFCRRPPRPPDREVDQDMDVDVDVDMDVE